MQQRQCVILVGDVSWCYGSAQMLLSTFNHDCCVAIADNRVEGITTIAQKQVRSQLGKEFDAVIFDGLEQFNPDNLAVIIGTVKAGGLFILMLPEQDKNSLFLQGVRKTINKFIQRRQKV